MEHLRMWIFGVLLLLLTFVGPAVLPDATPVSAAKPEKVKVCHWDADNDNFELISIPVTQFEPKTNRKGKTQPVHGHGLHEGDVIVASDATQDDCDTLADPQAVILEWVRSVAYTTINGARAGEVVADASPPTNGGNGAGQSGRCTGNPGDRPAVCPAA